MAHGSFTNRANNDGDLSSDPGFIPDGAFGMRVGPVSVGLAVTTVSGLEANWDYVDTPGGAGGTSYGRQEHKSRILVLRSAVGVAYPTAGLLYRPHRSVQLGLSYTSPTHVHTEGEATGNVGAQLATLGLALRPDFRYDAEVDTHFPQMVAAGLSWDDPVPLQVVERLLSGDGHTVSTATNGLEALEKFQVGWFDVVVTDHAMPEMSGAELAAMIKRLAPRKPVTLLALREALSTVK